MFILSVISLIAIFYLVAEKQWGILLFLLIGGFCMYGLLVFVDFMNNEFGAEWFPIVMLSIIIISCIVFSIPKKKNG